MRPGVLLGGACSGTMSLSHLANVSITPSNVSSIRQQTLRSIVQTISNHSSAVGIDLRPARIDSVALLLRDLSVLRRSVQPLCAQAHVHIVFECRAHADGLPHEALGLAFVECGHDFFAA
jgi:hypothetical protein